MQIDRWADGAKVRVCPGLIEGSTSQVRRAGDEAQTNLPSGAGATWTSFGRNGDFALSR